MNVSCSMPDLNNQAIAFLKAGNHHEASRVWQVALQRMRSAFPPQEELQDVTGQQDDSNLAAAAPSPLVVGGSGENICVLIRPENMSSFFGDELADDEEGSCNAESSSCSSGYNFRFFDRAFVMPTPSSSVAPAAWDDSRTLCVILYNLALCHTYGWRKSGTVIEKKNELNMAVQLYKMALSTIEGSLDNAVLETDNFVLLQLLAIFNNMGYLLYHSGTAAAAGVGGTTDSPRSSSVTCHCAEAIQALLTTRDGSGSSITRGRQHANSRALAGSGRSAGNSEYYYRDFLFFRWNLICLLLSHKQMLLAPAA